MGVPWKYGQLGMNNKLAMRKFKHALQRCRDGRCKQGFHFSVDLEGFSSFLDEVGPIPEGMKNPTLGRKDHSLGYQPGNVFWQEAFDNYSENGKRQGGRNRGTKMNQEQLSKHRRVCLSPERRAKISKALQGNQNRKRKETTT